MKTKTLYPLLTFMLALAAGSASAQNTLEGRWVVDKEWIDTIPTAQNDAEALEIYGENMGMVETVMILLPYTYYEFVPDGPFNTGLAKDGEEQLMGTSTSWQLRGDWIIAPDRDSLEFHWLEDGKLQLIIDRKSYIGTATFVRAEEN